MASSNKRKTTMAKMNRERKLVERRQEKQARKDARKRAAAQDPPPPGEPEDGSDGRPGAEAGATGPSHPRLIETR